MSKTGGNYASVVLGVSEQVAQDRRQGQHKEQINLISDPVRGLSRRWGTLWQAELKTQTTGTLATYQTDVAKMREYTFTIGGVEYCVLYRGHASTGPRNHFMFCYCKDTNTFIPVTLQSPSTFIDSLVSGGVSAITAVGRYLYIAGNTTTPTYTQTDLWGAASNQNKLVAWVRGGSYSRTYQIVLTKTDGSQITASYTTKASAYPVLNDTSSIPFYKADGTTPDPEYQKKINDANNLYNSNVTKWIGDAALDITPENIAAKLKASLTSQGVSATVVGSAVCINQAGYADITCYDGGDNSTMLGVGNEVSNIDKLSNIHYVGHIVRVRPQGATAKEAFYLRADAKSGVGTGWKEVIWRECAGVVQTPVTMFAQAVIANGQLMIADDPASLKTMTGDNSHPDWKDNEVGDSASCPVPNFYGKTITMMCVFQDRLLIGSEGVVSCSRPGDYLNFYRHTVLQVQDDDPVEMFSYGAEGDILRHVAIFDRDLWIFGDLKQYGISGRTVLSPKSPNISVVSSHEDSTQAPPQASGNLVFYGKTREGRTSMHQLQVGQLTDSPESYEVTQQLDTYLKGAPAQIVTLTSPNTVIFRTETPTPSLYVYNYIDTPAGTERVFDSWSTWEFNPVLGVVIGASHHRGELLIFMLRQGTDGVYVVADRQSLSTELSARPYMDSMRKYNSIGTGWHAHADKTKLDAVIDNTHESFLFGDTWAEAPTLIEQIPDCAPALWVGATVDGYVTPTNPFMRDSNGKAIVDGRLTLTNITVSVANSGGLVAKVSTRNGEKVWTDFIGRVMGSKDNVIGQQPIITDKVKVGIGAEASECNYTLLTQNWLPLTVTAIGWTGQYFSRVRRSG